MRLENLRGICNYVLNFIHFFFLSVKERFYEEFRFNRGLFNVKNDNQQV